MPGESSQLFKRVLEPMERVSEILFGLIMVLTFTCSFRLTGELDSKSVHTMLTGAIGCNLAWGIIDALFYLFGCVSERGHNYKLFRQVRSTTEAAVGRQIIADALPPVLVPFLPDSELELLRQKLVQMPDDRRFRRLTADDWRGAVGVFLLVVLSTFPVVIPFILFHNPRLALRISNGTAIAMLFAAGYAFGRYAWDHPWRTGVSMVVFGIAMVGVTTVLGG